MFMCTMRKLGDDTMKRINKIFLTGCGYAILILTMFYVFAAVSQFVSQSIAPGQFALILFFGFLISLAEFMYEQLKLKKALKCLIHYGVLLVAFCLIFVVSGKISAQRPAAVFASIVIYTALYFVIYAVVHFVRRAIDGADSMLDKKTEANRIKKENKPTYKSLYSDGD